MSKCLSPVKIYNGNFSRLIACGKCSCCRKKYADEVGLRMSKDIACWPRKDCWTFFVTLTYNDDCLPENGSLVHDDYSKFVDRFRARIRRFFAKRGEKIVLSIVGCGEYGSTTHRPHYHLTCHGVPFEYECFGKKGFEAIFALIEDCWNFDRCRGFVQVKPCDGGAAKYTAKYTAKSDDNWKPGPNMEQPFRVFPNYGLGSFYFDKYKDELIERGYIMDGEYRYSLPRYFVKKYIKGSVVKKRKIDMFKNEIKLFKDKGWLRSDYSISDYEYVVECMDRLRKADRILNRLKNDDFWYRFFHDCPYGITGNVLRFCLRENCRTYEGFKRRGLGEYWSEVKMGRVESNYCSRFKRKRENEYLSFSGLFRVLSMFSLSFASHLRRDKLRRDLIPYIRGLEECLISCLGVDYFNALHLRDKFNLDASIQLDYDLKSRGYFRKVKI